MAGPNNQKINNGKTDKQANFEYAKPTTQIDAATSKAYSSEINKKNAKKRSLVLILLLIFFILLLIGGGSAIYIVVTNIRTDGPSNANFDIDIYTELNQEGGGLYLFNCMPGDYYETPLRITNNSEGDDANIFVRFKLYIEDAYGIDHENSIISVFNNEAMWYVDDISGFNYYKGELTKDEILVIYNEFGLSTEISNELNGKQAKLNLVVDILEADMEAVVTYWTDSPISWALYMQDNIT